MTGEPLPTVSSAESIMYAQQLNEEAAAGTIATEATSEAAAADAVEASEGEVIFEQIVEDMFFGLGA